MSTYQDLLRNTKVEDLAPSKDQVIVLDSKLTVPEALKRLTEVGVLSAPVIDTSNNKYVGLVDALDILAYVVGIFEEVETESIQSHTIFTRLHTGEKFKTQPIGEITDFAHNPYTPVQKGSSVYDACKVLVQKKSHRAPIVDENGNIISILTQSAIVNMLTRHFGCLGDLGKKTVEELQLGTSPVITVAKTMRAVDAFKKMHESRVSGLGVIDHNNNLIGNLSARDIKAIDDANIYSSLFTSTSAFVQKIRSENINETHPAISCSESTTLEFILGRLAANFIHRLYVCSKDFHPLRVVSLRDVLAVLIKE
ncbi:5'-AMP-activated protein kinase subunit gamma [Acrasis kona]|uniref:5'-AMP-activated protein kinase subunit gamma n=1 Tax=Acrasis kona TaxID=1008807 RepID=A0AAW2ZKQ4_9EUKA